MSAGPKRADWILGAIAVGGPAAVAAAYYTQHVWNLQPCPWCVLQRLIFLALALAAALGLVWRSATGRRAASGLGIALAAGGVAAALWQHNVAAKDAASCDLSWPERFIGATGLDARYPDLFMPMTNCADAAAKLFGLPYEFWSLGLYALSALALMVVLARPRG